MDKITVDPNPTVPMIWGAIRIILGALGGSLVTQGILTEENLNTILGAVMVILPALWVAYLNRKNTKKLAVLADAAPSAVAEVKSGG